MKHNVFEFGRSIKNVLVVSKATRWECERGALNLDGVALHKELKRRGYPVERIKASHDAHTWSAEHIMESLKRFQSRHPNTIDSIRVKKGRGGLTFNDIKHIDLIISAGGDGTLLESASSISLKQPGRNHSKTIPILAVNTDPMLSVGQLCSVRLWQTALEAQEQHGIQKNEPGTISTNDFMSVLERIRNGEYTTKIRQRIRIDLVDENNNVKSIDRLALNEVFYAEIDASRPSVHETIVERPYGLLNQSVNIPSSSSSMSGYGIKRVQRSSGVIVCTGTGSTAWMLSASIIPQSEVRRILLEAVDVLEKRNLELSPKLKNSYESIKQENGSNGNEDSEYDHNEVRREVVAEVSRRVREACIFPPDSPNIQYFVREPVLNGWYGRHDTPLSSNPRRGFGKSISLRSLGWDSALTLDGLFTYRMRYGTSAVMSIDQDNPLHAIWFD